MTIAGSSGSKPNMTQYRSLSVDCKAGNHQFILPFQTSIKRCVISGNIKRYNSVIFPISHIHDNTTIINDAGIKAGQKIGYSGFPNTLADAIQLVDNRV